MNYSRNSRQFAQSMLQQQQQQYQQTTGTSTCTTPVLAVGSAGQKKNIEAEDNAVRQQFNPAMVRILPAVTIDCYTVLMVYFFFLYIYLSH